MCKNTGCIKKPKVQEQRTTCNYYSYHHNNPNTINRLQEVGLYKYLWERCKKWSYFLFLLDLQSIPHEFILHTED